MAAAIHTPCPREAVDATTRVPLTHGNTFLITGLVKLRARVAWEMEAAEQRHIQARADLSHIDAVIRMLAAIDPDAIKAKRINTKNQWFKHGEARRLAAEVLLEADTPMTTMDLAAKLLERMGFDPTDKVARRRVRQHLLNTLSGCDYFVSEIGPRKERWWRLV